MINYAEFFRNMGKTKKTPNPIDKHVGKRLRMQRRRLGMSQRALGTALGLKFQQIQNYEKGTNRIGSSRLHQVAAVLRVMPEFFFKGVRSACACVLRPSGTRRTCRLFG
jgi:transcriptional regulator with XRE-family HTH domain